jgi:hypothetical protein
MQSKCRDSPPRQNRTPGPFGGHVRGGKSYNSQRPPQRYYDYPVPHTAVIDRGERGGYDVVSAYNPKSDYDSNSYHREALQFEIANVEM